MLGSVRVYEIIKWFQVLIIFQLEVFYQEFFLIPYKL